MQPAVLGVVAEKQSAEVRSAAGGIRPADHNELLAIQALGLEPQAAIARHVGLLEPFRDDALETQLAGVLTETRTVTSQLVFFAFDLLFLNGQSTAQLPLIERKERLKRLFKKEVQGLRYNEHVMIRPAFIRCRL